MTTLPESLLRRITEQLGNSTPAFLDAMRAAPFRGIRFNAMRSTTGLLQEELLEKVPWEKDGWILKTESDAGKLPEHEAGAYYLQEPSAMLPGAVMDAAPGEQILDLCAAPGGKSTQMGIHMQGRGLLICNEPIPKRALILSRIIERMGIPNSIVTCAYPEQLAQRWPGFFDGVLADVPCSGEGMFRRNPEAMAQWSPERASGCVERQQTILEAAAKLVRPGGRLVYSTCTWNPQENEGQIESFLKKHNEFHLEPFSLPGVDAPEGMVVCWPHLVHGEGQFVARLRRGGDAAEQFPAAREYHMTGEEPKAWSAVSPFLPSPTGRLGSCFYYLPWMPDLSGLRVLRLGLHLGTLQGKTIIPDHAAALCFTPPDAPAEDLDRQQAAKYLSGESLPGKNTGWVLMRFSNLILGWGKGSEGRIRNHYPKGLRKITQQELEE